MNITFKKQALRDLDNVIVEFIIEALKSFDKEEDNYMSPKDRTKIYRLIYLLEEYRNWYDASYNEVKWNVEEWEKKKKKEYNEMFKLLKYILPLLFI